MPIELDTTLDLSQPLADANGLQEVIARNLVSALGKAETRAIVMGDKAGRALVGISDGIRETQRLAEEAAAVDDPFGAVKAAVNLQKSKAALEESRQTAARLAETLAKSDLSGLSPEQLAALNQELDLANKRTKDLAAQVDKAARASSGFDTAAGRVEHITRESERATDALKEMADRLSLEGKVGLIGDLTDSFEKTNKALHLMSDEAAEAVIEVGDLAEKGAMTAAVFGPIPALVGGALGAIVGVVGHIRDAFDDTEARAAHLVDTLGGLSDAALRVSEATRGLSEEQEAGKDILVGSLEFLRQQERGRRESLAHSSLYLADLKSTERDIEYSTGQLAIKLRDLRTAETEAAQVGLDITRGVFTAERARKEAEAAESRLKEARALVEFEREYVETLKGRATESQADYLAALAAETSAQETAASATGKRAAALEKIADLRRAEARDARESFGATRLQEDRGPGPGSADVLLDVLGASALSADAALTDLAGTAGSLDFSGLPGLTDTAGVTLAGELERVAESTYKADAALAALKVSAREAIAEGIGTAGSAALTTFFDNVQAGIPLLHGMGRAFLVQGGEAVKGAGVAMAADGLKNVWLGRGKVILGDPTGAALTALGRAEMVRGVALAGGGAIAARLGGLLPGGDGERGGLRDRPGGRGGTDVDGGPRVGSISSSGPVLQGSTTIVVQTLTPGDPRTLEQIGETVTQAQRAFARAGGGA